MIARSGTYSVRSRIIDDDKAVYADFEWQFKLAKVSSLSCLSWVDVGVWRIAVG